MGCEEVSKLQDTFWTQFQYFKRKLDVWRRYRDTSAAFGVLSSDLFTETPYLQIPHETFLGNVTVTNMDTVRNAELISDTL